MPSELRQSTALTLKVGPFVDATDGSTPETALTITQADVRLSKNGGLFAQKNDATAATHDENGFYLVTFNATDVATLGRLRFSIQKAGALPVWRDLHVVHADFWDWKYAGEIPNVTTAGSGAYTVPYYVYQDEDAEVNPIADVHVWVTSDIAGQYMVASGDTDSNGLVTFYLDAGTYYFWRRKSGWNFTNPDTEVVPTVV